MFKKSRRAANTLSKGVNYLLKKNSVDLIQGQAKLESPGRVGLKDGQELTAKNILIATGSRPRPIPGFEFDGKLIISSDEALLLVELPKRIYILGGGAIGVEFAHIMNAFGVEVHLVEMLEQILPLEDGEVVEVLARSFKKRGIAMYTSTRATGVKKGKDSVTVSLDNGTIEAERLLVVVGRSTNIEDLGLEALGVKTDRGFIVTGDYYQSSIPGIFAVGDVVASPMLAHVASKEGEIAVEHMAGHTPQARVDLQAVPSGVYCEPQIASFGYTEKRAREEGLKFEKAVFPYRGVGKAVAVGKSEGLVKLLLDGDSREIVGAHIVGAEATELIHELLLAKTAELLPEDIARMIHAHPTLAEGVMEAARAADSRAIHA